MKNKMPLMHHLAELRRRVIWVLLIFAVAFGAGWFLSDGMLQILAKPLLRAWPDGTMVYTGLADALLLQFDLAAMFALFVTIPATIWHLWAFVSPGLKSNEKKLILPILIVSPLLFMAGAAFAYWIMFPMAFGFLVSESSSMGIPGMLLPNVKDYLSFTIGLLKVFGLAFQLPLVLIVLNRLGILSRELVVKSRRYAIVGIFIIAAILTPPDVLSQLILAIPLVLLFEASLWFMKKTSN
jgi:sec-independent protein translocase protein TatC